MNVHLTLALPLCTHPHPAVLVACNRRHLPCRPRAVPIAGLQPKIVSQPLQPPLLAHAERHSAALVPPTRACRLQINETLTSQSCQPFQGRLRCRPCSSIHIHCGSGQRHQQAIFGSQCCHTRRQGRQRGCTSAAAAAVAAGRQGRRQRRAHGCVCLQPFAKICHHSQRQRSQPLGLPRDPAAVQAAWESEARCCCRCCRRRCSICTLCCCSATAPTLSAAAAPTAASPATAAGLAGPEVVRQVSRVIQAVSPAAVDAARQACATARATQQPQDTCGQLVSKRKRLRPQCMGRQRQGRLLHAPCACAASATAAATASSSSAACRPGCT